MIFFAQAVLRVIILFQKTFHQFMTYLYAVELKTRAAHCGHNVHIYYPLIISGIDSLEIGNNVHINRGAFIRAAGTLKIGDNVHIGPNLMIYTVNHNYRGDALPYDATIIKKPVIIENNVWIGANVTITPGSTIGEGAIIGAGTVITGQVAPLSIVGSEPFRVIKYRDREHYDRLVRLGKYGAESGKLYMREG